MIRVVLVALVVVMGACGASVAQTSGRAHIGHNSDVQSGEAGAKVGTILYNTVNPKTPLPLSSGNVVPDTVKNLGAQQSPKDAWSNSAKSNSGLK